jgi:hypothetical protein
MTGEASEELKAFLALAGILVVVLRFVLVRRIRRREGAPPSAGARVEKATTWSLALLAAIGIGNYFGFDTRTLVEREEFDGYDLVHYYLNAKYFDELGYTHLYEAIVIADSERKDNYRKWRFTGLRDLDTSVRVPIRTVYARADEIKGLFSPRRWKQFKRDFRFLQRTIKRERCGNSLSNSTSQSFWN